MIKQCFSKKSYQRDLEGFRKISANPLALKLFRNLKVVHEIGHSLPNSPSRLDDHGVTNWVEVMVLSELYRKGKIDRGTFEYVFDFIAEYQNVGGESVEVVQAYKNSVLKKD